MTGLVIFLFGDISRQYTKNNFHTSSRGEHTRGGTHPRFYYGEGRCINSPSPCPTSLQALTNIRCTAAWIGSLGSRSLKSRPSASAETTTSSLGRCTSSIHPLLLDPLAELCCRLSLLSRAGVTQVYGRRLQQRQTAGDPKRRAGKDTTECS